MSLRRSLKEKRPRYIKRHHQVIRQHDCVRSLIAKFVRKVLATRNWKILQIPSSDQHLFHAIVVYPSCVSILTMTHTRRFFHMYS